MTIPGPINGESQPPRRTAIIILMAVVVAAVAAVSWWMTRDGAAQATAAVMQVREIPADARAPEGVRIRVRVLNATSTRGLARRVTNVVRELGFDVVDYDNAREQSQQSVVMANTGNRDWAERLARGLQIDSVTVSNDSSLFTDLTVLVGSDWRADPSYPFRP